MEIPLLRDLVIIFSLSVVVIYGCRQVKLPILVGLLVTGMLVGPRSFGLIHEVHLVEVMAEIGIILLLFSIPHFSSHFLKTHSTSYIPPYYFLF